MENIWEITLQCKAEMTASAEVWTKLQEIIEKLHVEYRKTWGDKLGIATDWKPGENESPTLNKLMMSNIDLFFDSLKSIICSLPYSEETEKCILKLSDTLNDWIVAVRGLEYMHDLWNEERSKFLKREPEKGDKTFSKQQQGGRKLTQVERNKFQAILYGSKHNKPGKPVWADVSRLARKQFSNGINGRKLDEHYVKIIAKDGFDLEPRK